MVSITLLGFYLRMTIINYRSTLEVYQAFMGQFKETPRTKIVKKYLVDDPILEASEENTMSQQRLSYNQYIDTSMPMKMGTIRLSTAENFNNNNRS